MSPERRRRLIALGRVHDQWVQRHLDDAPFHPRGEGSDYNLHVLDVEASPEQDDEFTAAARRAMGLDPETGHRLGRPSSGPRDQA